MGRELRSVDRDLAYHVFCRGSNKGPIVFDRFDSDAFAEELDRVASRFHWEVFAWCLMPNHHHVVLRAEQGSFSGGFQQLNGNHSRNTNKRHGRTDHLFRNRPRAVCCRSGSHLIAAAAYVVRNPVAAGLVAHAGLWPWSSYRATMGLVPPPDWLQVDALLDLVGSSRAAARGVFERLVHSGRFQVSDTGVELLSS
jgi:REP element-mobilizing transposase RayT